MSENVAASTASSDSSSSSSASDTASIAASVIADMEADTSGETTSTEAAETPAETARAAETKADTKADIDPDDFDALPAEVVDSLGRKKENRLPHSRVKAMIAKAIEKQKAAWDGEVTPIREEHGQFKERVELMDRLETIAQNEPERYMEMLGQVNPAYKAFVKQVQQAQAAATQAGDDDDPMPGHDYDLGDGRMTYSQEGLEKRMEWERRQAVKAAKAEFEKELGPIKERYKSEADREKAAQMKAEMQTRLQKKLDRAKTWPGFNENSAEILKAFQASKDPDFDLHDAYLQVYIPKVAADRTKLREELIAENNALPKSTSTASTAAATKKDGPKSTADIARQVMRELAG